MGTTKLKQDQLWSLGQEQGERAVLEGILRRYYPDKSTDILRLADQQGDTAVFDGMLRQMMDDGHFGTPFVAPTTPDFSGAMQGPEQPPKKDRSPFAIMQEQEDLEALGRAKLAETITKPAQDFGSYMFEKYDKEYIQPYKTAKKMLFDVPMAKVQEVERAGIRRGIAAMGRHMVYMPSIEDAKEFIEARNWKAIAEMAEAGRFPTAQELGSEYVAEQLEAFGQDKKLNDTQKSAVGRMLKHATTDPASSWLRRGEIPELWSAEWVSKHPNLSILPMIITAPFEEVAHIATSPTEWDELVMYYTAGRLVLAPATKAGVRYLSTKDWATKAITPLKALGRKFPKKQPIGVDDIQSILRSDPDVADDILRAFTQLNNQDKANLARAVKMGKPVHLATPRFKGGPPAFGQPPVEHLASGIDAVQRPFYPPVPVSTPPVTPPGATPTSAPLDIGYQGTLPIVRETPIAERAAGIPGVPPVGSLARPEEALAALPEAGRDFIPTEMRGMFRPFEEPTTPEFHPLVPVDTPSQAIPLDRVPELSRGLMGAEAPPEPAGLLPSPEDTATRIDQLVETGRTGITADQVNMLRLQGFSEQEIMRIFGPAGIAPEGAQLGEAAAPIGTTAESVEPAGEAIPLGDTAPEAQPPAQPVAPAVTAAADVEVVEMPIQERPVRVIRRGRAGRVDILPGKNELLAEIDTALATAPDVEIEYPEGVQVTRSGGEVMTHPEAEPITPKVRFTIDGLSVEVFNTKKALTNLRNGVQSMPVAETPTKLPTRRAAAPRISAKKEVVGEMIKGMPAGYFSDGTMIVKGTPPRSAKFSATSKLDDPEPAMTLLRTPTDPADPQYYLSVGHQDIGVSSQPIVSFEKDQVPALVFRSGDKFAGVGQYRHNVVKKRYPDAKWGMNTSSGMMVAKDDGEPVAVIMARKVFGENYPTVLDSPPGYTIAQEAGLIDEMADAQKDIAELRQLGYHDNTIERISGADAQELIRDQIPAEEVLVGDHGEITRIGGAAEPRPVTQTTEELTAENVKQQDEIREQDLQAGFLGIPKRNPFSTSKAKQDFKEIARRVTGNDEYADAFYQSRDEMMLWERMKKVFGRAVRDGEELVRAEANSYLWRAAKSGKYTENVSKEIAQFANKNRTQYQTTRERGMQVAHRDAYGIWGELDADQSERLTNLIFQRAVMDTLGRGMPEIADIKIKEARTIFTANYRLVDARVRDAFDRYDKFQKAFSYQHLVDRGHLDPNHVVNFYAPEQRLPYSHSGFNLPQPARPRHRTYLRKRTGSEKAIRVGLETISQNWGTVHSDNMYEDFMLKDLDQIDNASREALRQHFGKDAAEKMFKGLQPHNQIPVEKGMYRVVQFEPGRYMFPGLVADPNLLRESLFDAAIDVDRLLSLPPDEQEKMLDSYLQEAGPRGGDAVRRAIILGRYKRLYVVPQEVSWRLNSMRAIKPLQPFLRQIARGTSLWKGITLGWAAVPYTTFQALFIDGPMQFLTAPGSIWKIPRAFNMMRHLHKLSVDPASMGPSIQKTYEIARDEGVFDSGFLREYMMLKPDWKKLSTYLSTPARLGAKRELLNRVAMVDYQWHERVAKGKPIEAIHFEKRIKHLTPEQQVGYVARRFTTDFEDLPGWYRDFFRNAIFPFITGSHKGSQTLASLLGNMMRKRKLRFVGSVLAPIAAVYLWNNTSWRKKIRDRLGWGGGRLYSTILYGWDDNNDGEKNRVLIWSPRTAIDEAGEWVGMDKTLRRLRALRRKSESKTLRRHHLEDFAMQTLKETIGGVPRKGHELMTPLLQIAEGLSTNIDPFSKTQVMPPEVIDTPAEAMYSINYIMKKLASPIENLARTKKGGNIEQKGPANWGSLARRIAGSIGRQVSPFRALGFRVIDLDDIRGSEERHEKRQLVNARRGFMRRIQTEFAWNRDLRMPEAIFDYYAEAVKEFQNVQEGGHPTTPVGRIFEDAKDRGVDLINELKNGPRQQGSIRNMLLTPETWKMKVKFAQLEGVSQTYLTGTPTPLEQPRKFTEAEKKEMQVLLQSLKEMELREDLADAPLAVREELLQQVLGLHGVDVEELLNELENQ